MVTGEQKKKGKEKKAGGGKNPLQSNALSTMRKGELGRENMKAVSSRKIGWKVDTGKPWGEIERRPAWCRPKARLIKGDTRKNKPWCGVFWKSRTGVKQAAEKNALGGLKREGGAGKYGGKTKENGNTVPERRLQRGESLGR